MRLNFVVGTGRSGSTLVSRILREHPDVLSLNEFFASLRHRALPAGPVTGAEFWHLLADPDPDADAMVHNGLRVPEHLYPYGTGRFSPGTGVPAICHMTLPMLTDDPDALFDELAAEIPGWPEDNIARQYRALFEWLCARFGKTVAVERSGVSLPMVGHLRRLFPDARFVHLYRNGPDCALSMSRHAGFRMHVLGLRAAELVGVPYAQFTRAHVPLLPAEFARMFEGDFTADFVMGTDLPLTGFGQLWSTLIASGTAALTQLPPDIHTSLRYESLLDQPAAELRRLAAFLGVDAHPTWLAGTAARIDGSRSGGAAMLDAGTLAALEASCAPGTRALAG